MIAGLGVESPWRLEFTLHSERRLSPAVGAALLHLGRGQLPSETDRGAPGAAPCVSPRRGIGLRVRALRVDGCGDGGGRLEGSPFSSPIEGRLGLDCVLPLGQGALTADMRGPLLLIFMSSGTIPKALPPARMPRSLGVCRGSEAPCLALLFLLAAHLF